jgi:putative heme transporter
VGALHLGYRTAAWAFGWALVNWIADVACLVCAIKAVGEPVPRTAILVVWTAGVGAASFSPVPAGANLPEVTFIAFFRSARVRTKVVSGYQDARCGEDLVRGQANGPGWS